MKDTTAQKWIDVLIKLEKKVDELEKKVTDNNNLPKEVVDLADYLADYLRIKRYESYNKGWQDGYNAAKNEALNLVYPWCADDDGSVGKIGDMRELLDDIEALPSVFEGEQE